MQSDEFKKKTLFPDIIGTPQSQRIINESSLDGKSENYEVSMCNADDFHTFDQMLIYQDQLVILVNNKRSLYITFKIDTCESKLDDLFDYKIWNLIEVVKRIVI